ncbi:DUF429 domain-containing protein [Methanothermobacter marburgensis]|uniref:DUF429 domain-containing protein n=1 Tax=Methanothermobacter marburgensis TaxID=145263 RepID=UPI0035B9741F
MSVAGVDLAASDGNETGVAIIDGGKVKVFSVFSFDGIIHSVKSADTVAVDAPLSLPRGRCCLRSDCSCSRHGHFRRADLEIRRYGSVLPLTWRGMRELTMRGIRIREALESHGVEVIETHPRTAEGMLENAGLQLELCDTSNMSIHQRDALTAALVALLYSEGNFIELGDPSEGTIILPDVEETQSNI